MGKTLCKVDKKFLSLPFSTNKATLYLSVLVLNTNLFMSVVNPEMNILGIIQSAGFRYIFFAGYFKV